MQASETIHQPTRCLGELWAEAKLRARVGAEARTELAHDAVMWNGSHRDKKKNQIPTLHHIKGCTLGTRAVSF